MTRVIRAGDGTKLPADFQVVIKVRSELTGGAMAILDETLPPKRYIPVHVHDNDVWVYVHTGEIGALIGDEVVTASAGSWV